MEQRKIKILSNLNDEVERVFEVLMETPDFLQYITAVYDEQAVEGSIATDNVMAAEIVRHYAKDHDVTLVAEQKLHTLVKSMNTVRRRYGVDTRTRRNTVGGKVVDEE